MLMLGPVSPHDATIADVLRNVVDIAERGRASAMRKMLDLSSPAQDRSKLVEVSLTVSPDLRNLSNSTRRLEACFMPMRAS